MPVKTYELVKTLIFSVEGLDHQVIGRVMRNVGSSDDYLPFMWDISHYCKPTAGAATVYIPSRIMASTAEETEHLLRSYGETFTTIDVTPNEFF